ncbi:alpha-like protein 3, partial [Streptococcus agalactiae COH1]
TPVDTATPGDKPAKSCCDLPRWVQKIL